MIRPILNGGCAGWIFASSLPIIQSGDVVRGSAGILLAAALIISICVRLDE